MTDLNRRPSRCKQVALPTELIPQKGVYSLVEDHSIGEGANKEVNDPNVFRRLKAWCSSSVESALLPIGRHLAVGQHIADLGASVPAVEVLGRRIRALLWPLIKLILLEGRVLFYSRNAARAS